MGRNGEHNAKVLLNSMVGLSTENKKKAKDIINLYKDNIIGTYRQAENLIGKLSSRGKGQQKLAETVKRIRKVKIITNIFRKFVNDPKSITTLMLKTNERRFDEIYNNPGSETHQDIYPTVLDEVKKMLKKKKSMKLNMVVHFEIARLFNFKDDKKRQEFIAQLKYPERLGFIENSNGTKDEVYIKPSNPYSTKTVEIRNNNVDKVLLDKGDALDAKLLALAQTEGSGWFVNC